MKFSGNMPSFMQSSSGLWFDIKMLSYQYRKSQCGDKIRWYYNRLISTMGFPILVRWHLYIESVPRPSNGLALIDVRICADTVMTNSGPICILGWHRINSPSPGRSEWNLSSVIFKLIWVIDGWGISCEIAITWMSLHLTDDKSTLVQVMAWCCRASSHYLTKCWPRSMESLGHNELRWTPKFWFWTAFIQKSKLPISASKMSYICTNSAQFMQYFVLNAHY